jgi:hypothetical protein
VVAGTGSNAATLQSLNAIAPPSCNGIAFPQLAICDVTPGRDCTGNALVSVPGVGGGDEVWFNSGDGNYYATEVLAKPRDMRGFLGVSEVNAGPRGYTRGLEVVC